MRSLILFAIPFGLPALLPVPQLLAAEDSITELSVPMYGRHGNQVKQLQSTSDQSFPFPPGGLVRVAGLFGDLIVEGSDDPDVRIDVKKFLEYGDRDPQRLERVQLAAERRSDSELSITATAPSPNRFVHPFGSKGDGVGLETHIRVPRNTRLVIRQGGGTVSISNVTGAIDAENGRGDVVLWLADANRYAVDAKSKFGVVGSDFAGDPRLLFYRLGERFAANQRQPLTPIHLRVGFGGIMIKRLPIEAAPISGTSLK